MDYVKAYNKICETHSNQTDLINFFENKMEEMLRRLGESHDDKLMIEAEKLRKSIDRIKATETFILKELHLMEMQMEIIRK